MGGALRLAALVAMLAASRAAGVPKEKKQWLKDFTYAGSHMSDVSSRMYIEGEMYRTVCTCRPGITMLDTNCFPAKVEIQYNGKFQGKIDPRRLILDAENLRRLIGDPADLRLVPVDKMYFSDVDGRSSDEVLGTWGGDLGELLLGLAVVEDQSGVQIDHLVAQFVEKFLSFSTAPYFYMMTDTLGVAFVQTKLGIENFDPTRPPEALHARVLELFAEPEAHGCALVRNLIENPGAFGIRKGLVTMALRNLFKRMWDPRDTLGRKIKFYVLHSENVRAETAWVDFRTRGKCLEENRAVLFPPFSNDVSIYVRHPDAAEAYHNFTAKIADSATGKTVGAETLLAFVQTKAEQWDQAMVANLPLLAGLPRYVVYVDALSPEEVEEVMGGDEGAEGAGSTSGEIDPNSDEPIVDANGQLKRDADGGGEEDPFAAEDAKAAEPKLPLQPQQQPDQ